MLKVNKSQRIVMKGRKRRRMSTRAGGEKALENKGKGRCSRKQIGRRYTEKRWKFLVLMRI